MTEVGTPDAGMEAQREALVAATGGARRDLRDLATQLEAWLASQLEVRRVTVAELRAPSGAGVSNETFLFDACWEEGGARRSRGMVLRSSPTTVQLFPDPDFEVQYRLLDVLHREGLARVPEMLWLCEDTAVLGAPFYVMELVDGRVPVSAPVYNTAGFLFDASPAQRRTLWTSAVAELARIHRVPLDLVSFLDPSGRGGNVQQIDYWDSYLRWALGSDAPDPILSLAEWVRRECPGPGAPGLSWGDARIGNMVFDDGFRVRGVLDWEQASLAGCRHDLGWWLLFDDFHSTGQGVARLAGLGTRDETIALWEEHAGEPAGDLRWYEVFAGLKLALIAARTLNVGGRSRAEAGAVATTLAGNVSRMAGLA